MIVPSFGLINLKLSFIELIINFFINSLTIIISIRIYSFLTFLPSVPLTWIRKKRYISTKLIISPITIRKIKKKKKTGNRIFQRSLQKNLLSFVPLTRIRKKRYISTKLIISAITIRKKNERKEQAMEYFNDCFNISRTIKTIRKHLSTSSSRISSAIDGKVAWKFSRKRCNYEAKKRVREWESW